MLRSAGTTVLARRPRLAAVPIVAFALVAALGCSSGDDKTDGTDETTPSSMKATGEDAAWCEQVIDVDQQRGGGGLSLAGEAAALNQALVSLAATAPDEVQAPLQELIAATDAVVETGDPTATLDAATAAESAEAAAEITAWVSENCGGYEIEL